MNEIENNSKKNETVNKEGILKKKLKIKGKIIKIKNMAT